MGKIFLTPGSGGGGASGDVESTMKNVVDLLLVVAKWMGVALAIWGVVEFVMSLTQDMPEKKTKGILLLAGGVILFGVGTLLSSLGITI